MKIYYLPNEIRALVFDMDLTLYSNQEYGQYQIDSLVERLAKLKSLSFKEMNSEIENVRQEWALAHGGKKQSLSNILTGFGISMEENVRWRNEIYEPEKFLSEDPRLKQTLKELSSFYILGVVTNNPVLIAGKTLSALGVGECFSVIAGLDTCMIAKPHEMPFRKFSELSHCPPGTCVSIGDRFDVDLDIPLKMGMGGILVDGVEDVYELAGVLISGSRDETTKKKD